MSSQSSSNTRPTGVLRADLSAYSQSATLAPFTDTPEISTVEAQIAENEAHATRNEECACRREMETNVEEDEVMLNLTQVGRVDQNLNQVPVPDVPSTSSRGTQGAGEEEKLKAFRMALVLEGTVREQALETLIRPVLSHHLPAILFAVSTGSRYLNRAEASSRRGRRSLALARKQLIARYHNHMGRHVWRGCVPHRQPVWARGPVPCLRGGRLDHRGHRSPSRYTFRRDFLIIIGLFGLAL